MVLAVAGVMLVCPFILSFFGHGYVHGSAKLLRILSLSGLVVAAYALMGAIFKIRGQLRAMVIVNFTNAFGIILLAVLTARPFGLAGIGWAWF